MKIQTEPKLSPDQSEFKTWVRPLMISSRFSAYSYPQSLIIGTY